LGLERFSIVVFKEPATFWECSFDDFNYFYCWLKFVSTRVLGSDITQFQLCYSQFRQLIGAITVKCKVPTLKIWLSSHSRFKITSFSVL
jgi:hypothetical protein